MHRLWRVVGQRFTAPYRPLLSRDDRTIHMVLLGAWETVLVDGATGLVEREVIPPAMKADMSAAQNGTE